MVRYSCRRFLFPQAVFMTTSASASCNVSENKTQSIARMMMMSQPQPPQGPPSRRDDGQPHPDDYD